MVKYLLAELVGDSGASAPGAPGTWHQARVLPCGRVSSTRGSKMRVQEAIGSRSSAIHKDYRASLHPSKVPEPRYPSLKVVVLDHHPFQKACANYLTLACCCFAGALVPCCGGIFSRWLMADGRPKTKLRVDFDCTTHPPKWNFQLHLYDGQACCSMVVM